MATISDELLSQFLSFTATSSEDVARQYLEMANGDLKNAVGLFMEIGETLPQRQVSFLLSLDPTH
jgi:hypothetical protein